MNGICNQQTIFWIGLDKNNSEHRKYVKNIAYILRNMYECITHPNATWLSYGSMTWSRLDLVLRLVEATFLCKWLISDLDRRGVPKVRNSRENDRTCG